MLAWQAGRQPARHNDNNHHYHYAQGQGWGKAEGKAGGNVFYDFTCETLAFRKVFSPFCMRNACISQCFLPFRMRNGCVSHGFGDFACETLAFINVLKPKLSQNGPETEKHVHLTLQPRQPCWLAGPGQKYSPKKALLFGFYLPPYNLLTISKGVCLARPRQRPHGRG